MADRDEFDAWWKSVDLDGKEQAWTVWKAARRVVPAQASAPEVDKALSKKLWCDLKTDAERSNWLLLGRGYETGIVSASVQNEIAMAYHMLALTAAQAQAQGELIGFIPKDTLQNLHTGSQSETTMIEREKGGTFTIPIYIK